MLGSDILGGLLYLIFNYCKIFEISHPLHFYAIINQCTELQLQHFNTTHQHASKWISRFHYDEAADFFCCSLPFHGRGPRMLVHLSMPGFLIFSNSLSRLISPGFFILIPYFSAISGLIGECFENSYL
jgi:hypothetical protein